MEASLSVPVSVSLHVRLLSGEVGTREGPMSCLSNTSLRTRHPPSQLLPLVCSFGHVDMQMCSHGISLLN